MRWIVFVLGLALLFSPGLPASASGNTLSPLITGGENVKIKNVRILIPSANNGVTPSSGGTTAWYIVTFTFTNTTAYPMIPVLTRFVYTANDGSAVQGMVNGDPDLIGNVNNPHANDILKPGDSYEYTVGFLVNANTPGFIYYDRTGGGF